MKRFIFLVALSCLLSTPALAQTVDILYQGNAYTAPFYKGHTPWASQSTLTLLAVPTGASLTNSNYRWSRNGTVLGSLSGVGKNTLTIQDTVLSKPQTIKVELVNIDGEALTQTSVLVRPATPNLVVYEDNPLYGVMFHQEILGAYSLKGSEVTFTAFPFFFSATDRSDSNLNYKWQTGGGETETRSSVTYRIPDKNSGTAAIYTSINHRQNILQTAKNNFLVQFGNE